MQVSLSRPTSPLLSASSVDSEDSFADACMRNRQSRVAAVPNRAMVPTQFEGSTELHDGGGEQIYVHVEQCMFAITN